MRISGAGCEHRESAIGHPTTQVRGAQRTAIVVAMAKGKRFLTATLADGYVKTIGPTAAPFTHYWRIVAHIGGGWTEVFWGHAKSLREATGKRISVRAVHTGMVLAGSGGR